MQTVPVVKDQFSSTLALDGPLASETAQFVKANHQVDLAHDVCWKVISAQAQIAARRSASTGYEMQAAAALREVLAFRLDGRAGEG